MNFKTFSIALLSYCGHTGKGGVAWRGFMTVFTLKFCFSFLP